MMESARSLPYLAKTVSTDLYRYEGWEAQEQPMSDHNGSPANMYGYSSNSVDHAIPSKLQRRFLNSTRPGLAADTSRSCTTLPRPFAAAYSPGPQSLRSGGCAPAVALTTRSAQEPGYGDAASPLVLLARIVFADSCSPVY